MIVDSKADLGLQYLEQHAVVEYTADEERWVRWKIDLFMLPIVRILKHGRLQFPELTYL